MDKMIKKLESVVVAKSLKEVQESIQFVKACFEKRLATKLHLTKVTSPLFVKDGTGINDDLNGIERPVMFAVKSDADQKAVVVHSLAKWKRMALAKYGMKSGEGIVTDMRAIRADEDLDEIHSLFVDQWDWERVITSQDRTLKFLKKIVSDIYSVIKQTEKAVCAKYSDISPVLPSKITFVHTEELVSKYPHLTPRQREHEICKIHGAVFLIGIGGDLIDGKPHDGRASDYDDWSTPTDTGFKGINGDILVWNPVLQTSFELSSMGIRVDKKSLEAQLKLKGHEHRKEFLFHRMLLEDKLPLSIGGGIGQSRMAMFVLRKKHIGQVQPSIWPDHILADCKAKGVELL
ncbi:MAG: Aspartate-ammonia ligase [candidate division TM6 bacterium GW2011_GWF2_37_49]|nr:MAG: Aspartate-ammonia ligase [candidate division TM6 bacterium GW2011_GWF2_37_49]